MVLVSEGLIMSPSVRIDRTTSKPRTTGPRKASPATPKPARLETREFAAGEAVSEPRIPPELLFPADDALGG